MFKKDKTFKKKKSHSEGTRRFELSKKSVATLGSGDLKSAVKIPDAKTTLNDWLAVNTVDFYNQINVLYGNMVDHCTPQTCPIMKAGESFEYQWKDDSMKRPVPCSAPEYVDKLMDWVAKQIDDEAVFPSQISSPYPKNFPAIVKKIFKRYLRVYAHMYAEHFEDVVRLGLEAHLNTCFKHFYYFIKEFNLVDNDELSPLKSVIEKNIES
eukprot:GCRY01000856.1.p1 GENE.GCRY01000856.1~~GCRY01000856.1.p1  ORF type:complete len:210 (-),score=24.09 GCRY01000856.1:56-685(-)